MVKWCNNGEMKEMKETAIQLRAFNDCSMDNFILTYTVS